MSRHRAAVARSREGLVTADKTHASSRNASPRNTTLELMNREGTGYQPKNTFLPNEPNPISGHLALFAISVGLAYAVFNKGGAHPSDWHVALLIAGAGSLPFWLLRTRKTLAQPPLNAWLWTLIVALPLYALVQLVPFPPALLAVLSPARAELLRALAPIAPTHWAPLSTAPPATLAWFFRILAYLLILLTIREIAWRSSERPWLVVAPLFLIGTFEALLGMTQVAAAWPNGMARGTYVNRDHF